MLPPNPKPFNQRAYTLIELLEGIIAVALSRALADLISVQFNGTLRTVVFYSTWIIGGIAIFLCLLLSISWLIHRCIRVKSKENKIQKTDPQ